MPRDKEKDKGRKRKRTSRALIGRVKRAVKKSRRKMDEERFRKELQRTIKFLEGINLKIASPSKKSTKQAAAEAKTPAAPTPAPAGRTPRRPQAKKKK